MERKSSRLANPVGPTTQQPLWRAALEHACRAPSQLLTDCCLECARERSVERRSTTMHSAHNAHCILELNSRAAAETALLANRNTGSAAAESRKVLLQTQPSRRPIVVTSLQATLGFASPCQLGFRKLANSGRCPGRDASARPTIRIAFAPASARGKRWRLTDIDPALVKPTLEFRAFRLGTVADPSGKRVGVRTRVDLVAQLSFSLASSTQSHKSVAEQKLNFQTC